MWRKSLGKQQLKPLLLFPGFVLISTKRFPSSGCPLGAVTRHRWTWWKSKSPSKTRKTLPVTAGKPGNTVRGRGPFAQTHPPLKRQCVANGRWNTSKIFPNPKIPWENWIETKQTIVAAPARPQTSQCWFSWWESWDCELLTRILFLLKRSTCMRWSFLKAP